MKLDCQAACQQFVYEGRFDLILQIYVTKVNCFIIFHPTHYEVEERLLRAFNSMGSKEA